MDTFVKVVIKNRSKFEEACRKVAVELFSKPYRYLSERSASKVRKIAYNRLVL